MEFRLAKPEDLSEIQAVYRQLIEHMGENNVVLWNDEYPHEVFEEDIASGRLFVLLDDGKIISAVALNPSHEGASAVGWEEPSAMAVYLERLGVHAAYERQGIGRLMVEESMEIARQQGAAYLRLFVVDVNEPAMRFYESLGFKRVEGLFELVISDDFKVLEFGFEAAL